MINRKTKYDKAIEALYKLIKSKPDRSIITINEVVEYVNKSPGRYKLTHQEVGKLNLKQNKYIVFKNKNIGATKYIYVKKDDN